MAIRSLYSAAMSSAVSMSPARSAPITSSILPLTTGCSASS
jgi:hypothetical protein